MAICVGGYFINREIGERLLFKAMDKGVDKSSVRRALTAYADLKNADEETLSKHREDHANFVRNYRRLLRTVEDAKITICSGITTWRLDADLSSSPARRIDVPTQPLSAISPMSSLRIEARDLRDLFEDRIWKQTLLPAIRETLKRAELELNGKRISIVLLSGGSSKIKWLKPLIERDLFMELNQAQVLELNDDFQEIVSKGLAVECARRFYTEGKGDFRAVTYNRLCLALGANGNTPELKKMIPETKALAGTEISTGVLLPSATSLKGLIGEPLRWKVRLSKAPTQSLDYYFMRSSFDPEDMSARQNLDYRVHTPSGVTFSSSIQIELTVRKDGTAEPVFIYGTGSQGKVTTVPGKPFYLDMTFATEEAGVETYLGFDFGTSTSSLCYVDGNDIRAYTERARDLTWLGLSALTDILPYPVAHPLHRFLAETSIEQMERWGREAFEAMLMLAAYIAYFEHCAAGGMKGGVFRGFRQRSAGPLWKMLTTCSAATGKRWQIAPGIRELTMGEIAEEIDKAVSAVAQFKHGKRVEGLDYSRLLEKTGNVLARALTDKAFGYFEDARRKAFSMKSFQGVFRNARGHSAPFIDIYKYEGLENFPSEFVFLVDLESGKGLPLYPLILRGIDVDRSYRAEADLFVFDIVRGKDSEIAYRAIQERDEIVISEPDRFSELHNAVSDILTQDPTLSLVEGITLNSRAPSE
jgi:hypothetical protein